MSGKLRPTERVLSNLTAIAGQVQAIGATRGTPGSGKMRSFGGGSGGSSRIQLTGGGSGLPELINLQAAQLSLLGQLVQLTATGIKGRDSLTRSSR